MIILSKGVKKPQTGDFGDVWFPALEDNAQLQNDHNHDGVNSEKIPASSLFSTPTTLLNASFAVQPSGVYRATLTVPAGGLVDNLIFSARDPISKDQVYLQTEKLSATQLYVYSYFPQDYEVFFGV
jgi:hypothetical protein